MRSTWFSVLAMAVALRPASAESIVALDFVVVEFDGAAVYGDHFDDGILGEEWEVLGGAPGPEAGTTLELRPDDFIVRILAPNPGEQTHVLALMDLAGLEDDGLLLFPLFGDEFDHSVALVLGAVPGFAFMLDFDLNLLAPPVSIGPALLASITVGSDGNVTALANGQPLFSGLGGMDEVHAIGFVVTPEPGSSALLASGAALLLVVRRRRMSARSGKRV